MKSAKYFVVAFVFLFLVNCSAASRTTTENANIAWQNSSEMQTTNINAAPSPTAETPAQTVAPDALIKDLYKTHEKNSGAIVQGKNRKILDKYFDKNLANLIWKDMTTNQDEVGAIDFDIFYNTQDPDIKNLSVGAAKITDDKAVVPVTFINYDTKNNLSYDLVKENAAWKISDIHYGETSSLLNVFKETAQNGTQSSSPSGEFEGKYQVGDTTCTVTPIKMAFEVKWSKGTGTEMFFYQDRADDRYIFASDPPTGKANSFAFDDENYNAGTFYRADGKEFPVKRIK